MKSRKVGKKLNKIPRVDNNLLIKIEALFNSAYLAISKGDFVKTQSISKQIETDILSFVKKLGDPDLVSHETKSLLTKINLKLSKLEMDTHDKFKSYAKHTSHKTKLHDAYRK